MNDGEWEALEELALGCSDMFAAATMVRREAGWGLRESVRKVANIARSRPDTPLGRAYEALSPDSSLRC